MPAAVFAATVETLADVNADGIPEASTSVFGGVLSENGGAVQSIALKPDAANPALDAGQDNRLDENHVGDLNGD